MIEAHSKVGQKIISDLLDDGAFFHSTGDAFLLGYLSGYDGVTLEQIGHSSLFDRKRPPDDSFVRAYLTEFKARLKGYYQTPSGHDSSYRVQIVSTPSRRYRVLITSTTAAKSALRVFLCHSKGDKRRIRALYAHLSQDGFVPWLDEQELLPGQEWESEIRRSIRRSDVVLVCLSPSSVTKQGFVQKEIRIAIDIAEEMPDSTVYIIPVLLIPCTVPDRLRRWQWIDLSKSTGYERLARSLNALTPRTKDSKRKSGVR